ncbi:fatty acid desaturase [Thalassospira sp. MA62]|nr:fatty acid desaturase [Thalassospira sp. MA62]
MSKKVRHLRSTYARTVNGIADRNSPLKAFSIIALNLLIAVSIGVLSLWLWHIEPVSGVLVYVVAIVVIGTRYRAFANMVHECSHNGLTRGRHLNLLLGRLICIPLFFSMDAYKKAHNSHHLFTGDYERDLDFKGISHYKLEVPLTRKNIKTHLWRAATLRHIPYYLGRPYYKEDPYWCNAARITYLVLLIFFAFSDFLQGNVSWFIIGYVAIPYFTTFPFLSYLLELADHGGLLGKAEELEKTRNYLIDNRFLHLLFFPRNDSYHLLHHLFPGVPTDALPEAHKILMQDPEYADLPHRLDEWLKITFPNVPNTPLKSAE